MSMDGENYLSASKLSRGNSNKRLHEFYVNDIDKNASKYKHKDNSIDTTKYNIFTFLPKALLFQFMRLANCYFLVIAVIQCIPDISPLSPTTAIAPIAFVLCVSIIREGIEDYVRHQYDTMLNNERVLVLKDKQFVESTSGSLKIGEIILVHENDPLPADLILLDSNLRDGVAYIETGTLDGEKSLKPKIAHRGTHGFFNQEEDVNSHVEISGHCMCDAPNSELYKLEGNLEINILNTDTRKKFNNKIPIEAKQLLLKGAILRNTRWIVGCVIYTGKNTKLILNSKKPRVKFSRVENLMSRLLIFILILQMILCIICSILNSKYYEETVKYNPYVPPPLRDSQVFDSFINYFTYMLLLNTMIPISLIITLEIVKLIQGYFTNVDVEMYSFVRDRFAKAGSISLNEELGAVNFIFSDKTGTLTCNKMQFKYCVIGDVCYEYNKNFLRQSVNQNIYPNAINDNNQQYIQSNNGYINSLDEENKIREENNIKLFGMYGMYEMVEQAKMQSSSVTKGGPNSILLHHNLMNKTKYDDFILKDSTNQSCLFPLDEEHLLINEFWKALAITHECVCNESEEGIQYSGLSPDDIELVKTAADQGYQYMKPPSNDFRRIKIGNVDHDFEVLNLIEFTSDRKRMSIIIRDGNIIKLYMKGADSEIKTRLHRNSREDFWEASSNYVELFSAKGFRTLLMGMKVIDKKNYDEWSKKLAQAELNLRDKKKEVEKCYAEIENDIYLIGATVVEDKLQDGVPDTIRDLRLAGIKIWMLTGDKMNTAYNIGLSCNLISKSLRIFSICGEKGETVEKLLTDFSKFCQEFNNENNGNMDWESEKNSMNYLTASHPFSIIVDAVALTSILKSKNNIKVFLDIATQSTSVICCRVSPLQKSEVVAIVKNYNSNYITLSIGDGGNDVSMIMEAHIGVGVYGEEGMRAVQASDFAIGEFKLLRRLLMFHGRMNNIRVSEMILYFFFKNFVFTILHFFYGFYNNFSGQTIIDDWFISLYNMIFTAVPLAIRALSDFDIIPDDGIVVEKMMPFLYKETRDTPIFTNKTFLLSLFRGIIFGVINFFFTVISLDESCIDNQGNYADIWYISANLFTSIIFIVSFRLINVQRHFIWLTPFIMFFTSWMTYFAFVAYVNFNYTYKSFATFEVVFGSLKFYLNLVLTVVITYIIDKAIYAYHILFENSIAGILMIERNIKRELVNFSEMPVIIQNAHKKYAVYEGKEKKLKIKLLFFYLLILLNCKAYKTFNYINNLSNFIV
jgi:phospholipid-transporting ATPase